MREQDTSEQDELPEEDVDAGAEEEEAEQEPPSRSRQI